MCLLVVPWTAWYPKLLQSTPLLEFQVCIFFIYLYNFFLITCCSDTGWWVLSTDGTFLFTLCGPSGRRRGKSEVSAELNRFKLPSGICHWPFQGGTPVVSLSFCLWRLFVLHIFIIILRCFLFLCLCSCCICSTKLWSFVFVLCWRVCGCRGCLECCFPWSF